nr:serine protease [Falsochrobactrum shanghaiense]
MVDGRFPTSGALTSGAGIVVGRKGGLIYIATAGHVVRDLMEEAENIRVQFPDRPGLEVSATIFPASFDKGIDVALLIVPQSEAPETIASLEVFPTARMSSEIQAGEGVYLFGQPGGKVWSGNGSPEKVQASRTTELEVESNTVIPGLSGGAALDEGLRIVGIIVETDNGVARSIPIRFLKEIIEGGGYPFMLADAEAALPDIEIDPLEELTKRGYKLSGDPIVTVVEFVRALEMGRGKDAELFIAAGVPLDPDALASRVAVPADMVDALLHNNLIRSRSDATVLDWCRGLVRADGNDIASSYMAGRFARFDNSYLFQTACKDEAPRIKQLLTKQIQRHEEWLENVKKDEARLKEIQRVCRDVMAENAPLSVMAENLYKAAHEQSYDALDLEELGEAATKIIHQKFGGGEHMVFNSYAYDDYGFAKSAPTQNQRLAYVYREIDEAAWATANGAHIRGNAIYYGNKLYKTIPELYADIAPMAIHESCNKNIRFINPNRSAQSSYEDARHIMKLLGG